MHAKLQVQGGVFEAIGECSYSADSVVCVVQPELDKALL